MSLFRILAGDSSRISTDITPFHDGWAYFTTDDGGFYIDSTDDAGNQKRTRIGGSSSATQYKYVKEFPAEQWQNGTLTIPSSEHKLTLAGGLCAQVYMLSDGSYTDKSLAAMDTQVYVDDDKNVVLSYIGIGYSGKVVLFG